MGESRGEAGGRPGEEVVVGEGGELVVVDGVTEERGKRGNRWFGDRMLASCAPPSSDPGTETSVSSHPHRPPLAHTRTHTFTHTHS